MPMPLPEDRDFSKGVVPVEPPAPSSRYVLPETTALALIGCVDLIITVALIAPGRAREANPVMARLLEMFGPWGFVIGKALFLAIPLLIAEYARKRHPEFVRRALRVGILLYVGIYLLLFVRYNVRKPVLDTPQDAALDRSMFVCYDNGRLSNKNSDKRTVESSQKKGSGRMWIDAENRASVLHAKGVRAVIAPLLPCAAWSRTTLISTDSLVLRRNAHGRDNA
jgi:hypothetical protein